MTHSFAKTNGHHSTFDNPYLKWADRIRIPVGKSTYGCQLEDNILYRALNIYESNICGCDYIGMGRPESKNLIDQHEVLNTNKFSEILFKTTDYIESISDINERNTYLNKFIKVLEDEQQKFDLLDDSNEKRHHKFELYSDELKTRINNLKNMVSINENNIRI